MDLTEYVEALRHSLTTAAAAAGDQARETARLLSDTMEPAVRLTVTDALAAMAAEVTEALDGALVDIRLRGRDPEVVVVPAEQPSHEDHDDAVGDAGATARISLRPPDVLTSRAPAGTAPRLPALPKSGAEAAAATAGMSLNTWLVRAVGAALRDQPPPTSS